MQQSRDGHHYVVSLCGVFFGGGGGGETEMLYTCICSLDMKSTLIVYIFYLMVKYIMVHLELPCYHIIYLDIANKQQCLDNI